MTIAQNLNAIKKTLPDHVELVAVSKTKSVAEIMEAYKTGQRVFGENKIQEMTQKWESLPKDIQWHMIGHVQRNKVKYMGAYVSLIHGVDSLKLLKEINKQAQKHNREIDCLLQLHIAEEASKFGFDEAELRDLINSDALKELAHIKIVGLMGMATFTTDKTQIRREFKTLKRNFDLAQSILKNCETLSMGMSGDYQMAIEEGSTMVRIGSSIFGDRNY